MALVHTVQMAPDHTLQVALAHTVTNGLVYPQVPLTNFQTIVSFHCTIILHYKIFIFAILTISGNLLISVAARRMTEGSTNDIEDAIKSWPRHAPERAGSHKKPSAEVCLPQE